eukprot:scaffold990_cov393-Prasinococcus_capsulatus_cf.AAC.13
MVTPLAASLRSAACKSDGQARPARRGCRAKFSRHPARTPAATPSSARTRLVRRACPGWPRPRGRVAAPACT